MKLDWIRLIYLKQFSFYENMMFMFSMEAGFGAYFIFRRKINKKISVFK